MIRNKRAQGTMVLKVIFAIIIFAILAYATFSAIRKILPSDKAEKSFNELIEKIKKAEEGLQSTPLYMDKNTLIVIFDRNRKVVASLEEPRPRGDAAPLAGFGDEEGSLPGIIRSYNFNIDRECNSGLCACLCRDFKGYGGDIEETGDFRITCTKAICGPIEDLNLASSNCIVFTDKEAVCSGGTIIERFREGQQRISAVYIEKSGNNIGICLDPPCLRLGGVGGSW